LIIFYHRKNISILLRIDAGNQIGCHQIKYVSDDLNFSNMVRYSTLLL